MTVKRVVNFKFFIWFCFSVCHIGLAPVCKSVRFEFQTLALVKSFPQINSLGLIDAADFLFPYDFIFYFGNCDGLRSEKR